MPNTLTAEINQRKQALKDLKKALHDVDTQVQLGTRTLTRFITRKKALPTKEDLVKFIEIIDELEKTTTVLANKIKSAENIFEAL